MAFRVWGRIDGVAFSQTYTSVAEWRAERKQIERCYEVEVLGMQSES